VALAGVSPLRGQTPGRDDVNGIDTLRLTAEDAIAIVERGEVSPDELHGAYLEAIGERDDELHAYLRTVDEADGTSIPIALKDVISTRGVETTAGSRILAGYVPVFDATVAARCKAAGLTLLGKTNTDEFAMGSSTENSAYGPSHNPWDPDRVPGGSGGGTAAAVSGGLAPWGLGSDTGGSIKQPSALCGNVGLRPTYGTVSRYGVVAFASSLDQVGPVAKTVRDTALLYRIISGKDPSDSTTVDLPAPVELPEADRLDGLRIGVPRQAIALEAIEPGVRAAFEAALVLAEELGADIGECDLPLSFDYGMPCYYLIAPAEASSNLARYDGVRYGPRSDGESYREMVERTRDDGFGDEPKRRIMLGTYALSAGYYDAYYGQAQKVRTLIVREHAAAFESYDVLATPTSPTVAFPLGEKAADPLAMYACDLLTIPSCLAGLPGLNVPCGLSDGLPVGLQLIGPQFAENTLFRAGHALQRALALDLVPDRLRERSRT
jgi:aspartyl-tRNA(Asn)/glutamyl-tRNA(Gln) amidotransferase subunit A